MISMGAWPDIRFSVQEQLIRTKFNQVVLANLSNDQQSIEYFSLSYIMIPKLDSSGTLLAQWLITIGP